MDDSRRGEYTKIPNIEMVTLGRKSMSLKTALNILGLEGMPSPKVYEAAVKKLLLQYADELGKRAEILAAHNRLHSDHAFVVEELRAGAKKSYAEYQSTLPSLITKVAGHSGDETLLTTLGKQIDKTNKEYCAALENEDTDLDMLTRVYMAAVSSTIHLAKCLIHKEPEIELRANLEKLRTNVNVAYEHAESRDTSAVDPVKVFKQEFDRYVGDIIKIRDMEREVSWQVATGGDEADESLLSYTRYQENLQSLHAKLKQLGDHYFVEIDKDDADVLKLQNEFNKGFKHIVSDAKKAFAKDPGIWANLDVVLQILFFCTIVPGLIILACEKTEDRNRLFYGAPKGEVNIQDIWKEWEMDVFPNPSDVSLKRGTHGAG